MNVRVILASVFALGFASSPVQAFTVTHSHDTEALPEHFHELDFGIQEDIWHTFIMGFGTNPNGEPGLTEEQFFEIQFPLGVHYSQGEYHMEESCGPDTRTIHCDGGDFDVHPGMDVTTVMTRHTGPDNNFMAFSGPTFTFPDMGEEKMYAILMVDFMSDSWFWGGFPGTQNLHMIDVNIPGNMGAGDGYGAQFYMNPGTPAVDAPSVYAFLMFEQNHFIEPNDVMAWFAPDQTQRPNGGAFNLQEAVQMYGLGDLVGMNWFRAWGTPYSLAFMEAMGFKEMLGDMFPTCDMMGMDDTTPVCDY